MVDQARTERDELAKRRLRKVLATNIVAGARTLEQKIADAGPNHMRVDPHVLTTARQNLQKQGVIAIRRAGGIAWYHLSDTSPASIDQKLKTLVPIHDAMQDNQFCKRLGQALEIAVYRALIAQPQLSTLGAFLDLHEHDDKHLYGKEEPPSTVSSRTCKGRLDFIVITKTGGFAGIEVKNTREWLYPDRDEVRASLEKCTALDIVPVLVARRIPYVTFKLLNACGAIIHQTYNQLFAAADGELANKAKHKDLLGYHDIRLGNQPDTRLVKFVSTNLPGLIHSQRTVFDDFKDLLRAFGTGDMPYEEFAARVRRRIAGTNEDHDWDEYDGER